MNVTLEQKSPAADAAATVGIASLEDLRVHLQWAIELEHCTIPPYLCALYSIDRSRNPEAFEVVQTVLVEEMLHLALAANLLNAVGGSPVLDAALMMPGYPRPLPHGDQSFLVDLLPFGPAALEMFLKIEQPSSRAAVPEGDRYETIGQFYAAIAEGLRSLCEGLGEESVFCGDAARQITGRYPYGGSGEVVVVSDLTSALTAVAEIVDQGEGSEHHEVWDGDHQMFHADRDEVGHFFRFQELMLGRRYQRGDSPDGGPTGDDIAVDWEGVSPMRPNQRVANAPTAEVRTAQNAFNDAYCVLLCLLEQAFNGDPDSLGAATGAMFRLRAKAQELLRTSLADGHVAGPTFEYVQPEDRR